MAELLRPVISQQRIPHTNHAEALIDAIRSVREQLIAANPVELAVGNVVRRTLHIIREDLSLTTACIGGLSIPGVSDEEDDAIRDDHPVLSAAAVAAVARSTSRPPSLQTILEDLPHSAAVPITSSSRGSGAYSSKVIVGVHAVMANGGIIAHVGLNMVALAAQRHAVPFVVLTGIHKMPITPHGGYISNDKDLLVVIHRSTNAPSGSIFKVTIVEVTTYTSHQYLHEYVEGWEIETRKLKIGKDDKPFENCSRGLEAPILNMESTSQRVDLQPNDVNMPFLVSSSKEPSVTNNNVITFGKKGLQLVPVPENISDAWHKRRLTRSKTVYAFNANFQISKGIQIMDEHREAMTASLSLSDRLLGWTIEFRERENGTVDKFYYHKSSNCMLRSTIEVETFILNYEYSGPQWREHGVTEESHLARLPWFDSSEGESKLVSSKRRRTPSSIGNNSTKRKNKTRSGCLDKKVTETIEVVPVQAVSLHPLQRSNSACDQPQISQTPEEMADGFFN